MEDWRTIEAENLKKLLGKRNKAEFARKYNIPGGRTMIHQHIAGHRPINLEAGSAYAKGLNVSLEQISERLAKEADQTIKSYFNLDTKPESLSEVNIWIPGYGVDTDSENSIELNGERGAISGMQVTRQWIDENLPPHTKTSSLRVVTGFDEAMRTLYRPGDPMIVDTGVKSFDNDGVYFFRIGQEGSIRHLQRVPGEGIVAVAQSPGYKEWVIDDSMDFEIIGKVLKAWNSSKP